MKLRIFLLITAAIIILSGCSAGYDLTPWELSNQTLTYYAPNGISYQKLSFDSTGRSGSYEFADFIYDFPTSAAAASGKYSDKAWYMNTGTRGSFNYDEAEHRITTTVADSYALKSGAVTTYSNDYEWRTLLSIEKDADPAATASGMIIEMDFFPNSDSMNISSCFSAGANHWEHVSKQIETVTSGGTATVETTTITQGFTITSAEVVDTFTVAYALKSGSNPAYYFTQVTRKTYNLNDYNLIGEDTGNRSFDLVWMEGNAVSLLGSQIKDEAINYEGPAAPATAPTVNQVTGQGSSSGGTFGTDMWSWTIDMDVSSTFSKSFTHFGVCIIDNSTSLISLRGLN